MTGYGDLSTEELIRQLVDSELVVDPELAGEISRRPDAVPYLLCILEDEEYYFHSGPGDGWTPIHAGFLLSAIGTPEALEAIFWVLREREEELDDWITDEYTVILANFSPEFVEPLKAFVLDRTVSVYGRSVAAGALISISRNHPEARDSVLEFFRELLKIEEDSTFLGFVVCDLGDYRVESLFEDVKTLFEEGRVDEDIVEWKDIASEFKTPVENGHRFPYDKDPMEHFSPEEEERLWNQTYKRKIPEKLREMLKPKKIGRNDPCPCGSGKKYKKCCMPKA